MPFAPQPRCGPQSCVPAGLGSTSGFPNTKKLWGTHSGCRRPALLFCCRDHALLCSHLLLGPPVPLGAVPSAHPSSLLGDPPCDAVAQHEFGDVAGDAAQEARDALLVDVDGHAVTETQQGNHPAPVNAAVEQAETKPMVGLQSLLGRGRPARLHPCAAQGSQLAWAAGQSWECCAARGASQQHRESGGSVAT